jgi:hypothetical protein
MSRRVQVEHENQRRDESRRGRHECLRHIHAGSTCRGGAGLPACPRAEGALRAPDRPAGPSYCFDAAQRHLSFLDLEHGGRVLHARGFSPVEAGLKPRAG